jgi:hypothetical protein
MVEQRVCSHSPAAVADDRRLALTRIRCFRHGRRHYMDSHCLQATRQHKQCDCRRRYAVGHLGRLGECSRTHEPFFCYCDSVADVQRKQWLLWAATVCLIILTMVPLLVAYRLLRIPVWLRRRRPPPPRAPAPPPIVPPPAPAPVPPPPPPVLPGFGRPLHFSGTLY